MVVVMPLLALIERSISANIGGIGTNIDIDNGNFHHSLILCIIVILIILNS